MTPQKMVQAEANLTDKEMLILRLMCEEKSTKEIADIVELSPRTVEAIRDKLKVKTGAKSTAGLILYAVKNNILDENTAH
jgi:DNA-binding CsgD family transcriptional regulator